MLTAIVMILIAAAVIAFVAWPLVSTVRLRTLKDGADALAELTTQRDAALRAIKDLEFDYQTGKVSADDYPVYDRRLREQALQIIHQLDTLQTGRQAPAQTGRQAPARTRREAPAQTGRKAPALDAGLEAEISAARRAPAPVARRTRPANLEQDLEAEIAARRSTPPHAAASAPRRFCVQCGQPLRPTDRFCGSCGAAA